jgi:hypothetical protein
MLHGRIQNRANLNRAERDLLYDQAKVVYCDHHYFLFLHNRIEFYSRPVHTLSQTGAPITLTTEHSEITIVMVVGHK